MKLTVLASGSKANAAVLESGSDRLLIDAGLSSLQLKNRMRMAKIEPESISAIILTHEHNDHCAGLEGFSRGHLPKLCANAMTCAALLQRYPGLQDRDWLIFETGSGFKVNGPHIESVSVCHDASDPCGFLFTDQNACLGFATDLGKTDDNLLQRLQRASTLFLEANYSDQMLQRDLSRTPNVKLRISSEYGHLSNAQAAAAVSALPGLQKVILGHLSAATNSPLRALEEVFNASEMQPDDGPEVGIAFTPESERCKPPKEYEIL